MSDLAGKKCLPCEGGVKALSKQQAETLLPQIRGWSISDDGLMIFRDFQFKGFLSTMAFVNAMAWIANQEDHHPDLHVSYRTLRVELTTHALGGLTENDFILAAKIDQICGS